MTVAMSLFPNDDMCPLLLFGRQKKPCDMEIADARIA